MYALAVPRTLRGWTDSPQSAHEELTMEFVVIAQYAARAGEEGRVENAPGSASPRSGTDALVVDWERGVRGQPG
jgi:hypothetical protein